VPHGADASGRAGAYEHSGVQLPDGRTYTFAEWAASLQRHFERSYWVPLDPADDERHGIRPGQAVNRGIYRDCIGTTQVCARALKRCARARAVADGSGLARAAQGFADFQFRPNQCVAMAIAPELFEPAHALIALRRCEETLMGDIGMKTLSPGDWR